MAGTNDMLSRHDDEVVDFATTNLDNSEPELCIQLLHMPNVQNYAGIKGRIQKSDFEWMSQFVFLDGIVLLIEALQRLIEDSDTADEVTAECVGCIRAVLNTKHGLRKFMDNTNNNGYMEILALTLSLPNQEMKKMVMEILSVSVWFSSTAYNSVINALTYYKSRKQLKSRFSVIISELKNSGLLIYKSTLLVFINSVIYATDDIMERTQLRNELITLGLLDVLEYLRKEDDNIICIQRERFYESKEDDDLEMLEIDFASNGAKGISHERFSEELVKKVSEPKQRQGNVTVMGGVDEVDGFVPTVLDDGGFIDNLWSDICRGVFKKI
ncbi:inverted formin-2-like [Glandiceps talaboti]